MDLDDLLELHFGDYLSSDSTKRWEDTKKALCLGAEVSGTVVIKQPFGVFVDIGVGFPGLILVVKLKGADTTPYTSMEMYPDLGTEVKGRVYTFVDQNRQIGITQLTKEPMLGEVPE